MNSRHFRATESVNREKNKLERVYALPTQNTRRCQILEELIDSRE